MRKKNFSEVFSEIMNDFKKVLLFTIFLFSAFFFAQNQISIVKKVQKARQKNPDSAITIAKDYLKLNPVDNNTKADLFLEISQCYLKNGNKSDAILNAMEAKKFAEKTQDQELIPRVYGSLATNYRKSGMLPQAKTEIKTGLNYIKNAPPNASYKWMKSAFLREYGRVLLAEDKTDSAMIYLREGLKNISIFSKETELKKREQLYRKIIRLDLADGFLKQNRLDSAEYYDLDIIHNSTGESVNDNYEKNAKLNLSLIYYLRKNYQKSIDTLKNLEKVIQEEEYPLKADLYSYLAKNYHAIGNTENYIKYNNLYLSTKEKLTNEEIKSIE